MSPGNGDVLESAGIDVSARVSAVPAHNAAAALVPMLREAATNILKHSGASHCVLEMTADAGQLRLLVSNDGTNDAGNAPLATVGHTGSGLGNPAARIEAAGGRLAAGRDEGGSARSPGSAGRTDGHGRRPQAAAPTPLPGSSGL